MKAHQRIIREKRANEDADIDLFGRYWENINLSLEHSIIKEIDFTTAASVIEKYEWLGRMPGWSRYAFGHYFDGTLGGVCVFGDTIGSPFSFKTMFNGRKILQLQRGVHVHWTPQNSASYFLARTCNWIRQNTDFDIITATCDPAAGEIGTIYQALNWKYIGLTDKRKPHPIFLINGEDIHPRRLFHWHGTSAVEKIKSIYGSNVRVVERQIKHRYVFSLRRHIKIDGLPYPKRNAGKVSSRDTAGTTGRAGGSSPSPLQLG